LDARLENSLSGACPVYAGLAALVVPHFQFRISGRSSPQRLVRTDCTSDRCLRAAAGQVPDD